MIGSVRTINKRHWGTKSEPGETIVSVDKSNKVLGNFYVKYTPRNLEERYEVIRKFKLDFDVDMKKRGPMYQEVLKLAHRVAAGESLALECWCAPLPCHADVIRSAVNDLVSELTGKNKAGQSRPVVKQFAGPFDF